MSVTREEADAAALSARAWMALNRLGHDWITGAVKRLAERKLGGADGAIGEARVLIRYDSTPPLAPSELHEALGLPTSMHDIQYIIVPQLGDAIGPALVVWREGRALIAMSPVTWKHLGISPADVLHGRWPWADGVGAGARRMIIS